MNNCHNSKVKLFGKPPFQVHGFTLEESNLVSKLLLNADLRGEEPDSDLSPLEWDPESSLKFHQLLQAAGIEGLVMPDGRNMSDPDVMSELSREVEFAVDEAASAMNREQLEILEESVGTTLAQACQDGDLEMVHHLLDNDTRFDVNEVTPQGDTALFCAVTSGRLDIVQLLLDRKALPDLCAKKVECTPLMEAASAGLPEMVSLLIRHGAKPEVQSSSGNTALHYAACNGQTECARLLLEASEQSVQAGVVEEEGVDPPQRLVEMENENGHTALMEAASNGCVEVATLLIQHKAGVNTHSHEFKESALTLASYKGHAEMVRFLLQAGANHDHRTDEMHTALMEAAMDGHVEVARILLEHDAQVNMPTDSFESPLTLAACGGHTELVSLLISFGADAEEVNDEGYTPLMEAAREGHESTVALLLDNDVDPNIQTEETQETALTLAACGGFVEVCRELLDYGGNIELASEGGRTPLMKASRAGNLECVQLLVERGAVIDQATSSNDHTALSLACSGGHLKVVEYLLQHNADPKYRLKDGSTMVIEASRAGHTDVIQLLFDYPKCLQNPPPPSSPTTLTPFQCHEHRHLLPPASSPPLPSSLHQLHHYQTSTLAGAAELALGSMEQFIPDCGSDGKRSEELLRQLRALQLGGGSPLGCSEDLAALASLLDPQLSGARHALMGSGGPPPPIPDTGKARLQPDPSDAKTGTHKSCQGNRRSRHPAQQQQQQPNGFLDIKIPPLNGPLILDLPDFGMPPSPSSNGRSSPPSLARSPGVGGSEDKGSLEDNKISFQPLSTSHPLLHPPPPLPSPERLQQQRSNLTLSETSNTPPPPPCCSCPSHHHSPQRRPPVSQVAASPEKTSCSHPSHLRHTLIQQQPTALTQQPQQQQPRQRRFQPLPDVPVSGTSSQTHRKHKHQGEDTCRNRVVAGSSCPPHKHPINGTGLIDPPCSSSNSASSSTVCHHHHHHQQPINGTSDHHHQQQPPPPPPPPLAENEIDVNACRESTLESALTLACMGGHFELVRLLLTRGAEVEHRDKKGSTPLHTATLQGQLSVIQMLLDHGADIEAQIERTKDTPLSIACSNGKIEIVDLLLNRGANKEHRNVSDYTPLSLAASGGFVDIIELLLQHSAEINSRTGSKLGISPLMLAAMNGHTEAVKLLLNRGSDINAQIETNKNTALTLACFQGREEVVRLLVERKTNIEHRAKTGLTPLMEAASGGYVEVGVILISSGADVNAPPVPLSRDTALTIAADKGHAKFVNLLLENDANVDVKNKKGSTPLWLACFGGHLEVAQKLIQHGADVNMMDNRRVSCLMTAFRGGHVKIVKLLVRHVSQFPSDNDCIRYIQSLSDKELAKRCSQCMDLIVSAKDAQEAEANKNARILLDELSQERAEEERRAAMQVKRRERKREKRKAKLDAEKALAERQSAEGEEESTEFRDEDSVNEKNSMQTEEPLVTMRICASPTPSPPEPNSREATPTESSEGYNIPPEPHLPDTSSRVGGDSLLDELSGDAFTESSGSLATNPTSKKRKRKKIIRGKQDSSSQPLVIKEISVCNVPDIDKRNSTTANSGGKLISRIQPIMSVTSNITLTSSCSLSSTPLTSSGPISSTSHTRRPDPASSQDRGVVETLCSEASFDQSWSQHLELKPSVVAQPLIQHLAMSGDTRWTTVPKKRHMLTVPSRDIGRVIGQSGCTVKSIREQTGAHIDIESQRPGQSEERVIHIKGSQEAVSKAIQMIEALIQGRTTGKEILAKASPRRIPSTVVPLAAAFATPAVPLITVPTNNRRTGNSRPLPIVKNAVNTNNNNTGGTTSWGGVVNNKCANDGINYAKIAASGVQSKIPPVFLPSQQTSSPASHKTSLEANFPTITESITLHRKSSPSISVPSGAAVSDINGSIGTVCNNDSPISTTPPACNAYVNSQFTSVGSSEELITSSIEKIPSANDQSVLTVNTSMTSSMSSSPPPSSTPTIATLCNDLIVPSASTMSAASSSPLGESGSSTKSFPRAPGSERSQQQVSLGRTISTPAHSPQLDPLMCQPCSPPLSQPVLHTSHAVDRNLASVTSITESNYVVNDQQPTSEVHQQEEIPRLPIELPPNLANVPSLTQPYQFQSKQEWGANPIFNTSAANLQHVHLKAQLQQQLQQQHQQSISARFETPSELLDLPRVSELNPSANSFQPRPSSSMSPPTHSLMFDDAQAAFLRQFATRSMPAGSSTSLNGLPTVQPNRFPNSPQQTPFPNRMGLIGTPGSASTMQTSAYQHYPQQQAQPRTETNVNYNLPLGMSGMPSHPDILSYNPMTMGAANSVQQTSSQAGSGNSVPTPIGAERRRATNYQPTTATNASPLSTAALHQAHYQSQPQVQQPHMPPQQVSHSSYNTSPASNWSAGLSQWSSQGTSQTPNKIAGFLAAMQQQQLQQQQYQQQQQQYQQQQQKQQAFHQQHHQSQNPSMSANPNNANPSTHFWNRHQQWPNSPATEWGLNSDKM